MFDDTLKTALTDLPAPSPFYRCSRQPDRDKPATDDPLGRYETNPGRSPRGLLRAGSKAYIAGAIGSLGSEYVLGLKAVNCNNGDTLAQEQVTVAFREQVLGTLGRRRLLSCAVNWANRWLRYRRLMCHWPRPLRLRLRL